MADYKEAVIARYLTAVKGVPVRAQNIPNTAFSSSSLEVNIYNANSPEITVWRIDLHEIGDGCPAIGATYVSVEWKLPGMIALNTEVQLATDDAVFEFPNGLHLPKGSTLYVYAYDASEQGNNWTSEGVVYSSDGFHGIGHVTPPRNEIVWGPLMSLENTTDKSGGAGTVTDSIRPPNTNLGKFMIWRIHDFKLDSTSNIQRRVYRRSTYPQALGAVDLQTLESLTGTAEYKKHSTGWAANGPVEVMDCTYDTYISFFHDSSADADVDTRCVYRLGILPYRTL